MQNPVNTPRPERMLTFKIGGWTIVLAVLLCAGVVAWRLPGIVKSLRTKHIGDSRHPESYGFEFTNPKIPVDEIVSGGTPKDGIPALVEPLRIEGRDILPLNQALHGKYVVSEDRVIGVEIGGEAVAYPLSLMDYHEVANDLVGGMPIAVTYNGLCDSALVFDRRIGTETLEFGVSGLLYNSNLLMYDRRAKSTDGGGAVESLWSQMAMKAVTGPAAMRGDTLKLVPFSLMAWKDWLARHPATKVAAPESLREWADWRRANAADAAGAPAPILEEKLSRSAYSMYFGTDDIRFPVNPKPPKGIGLWNKDRVVALREPGGQWHVFALVQLQKLDKPRFEKEASDNLKALVARIQVTESPLAAIVDLDEKRPLEVIYCFWFAWHAMNPEIDVETLPVVAE